MYSLFNTQTNQINVLFQGMDVSFNFSTELDYPELPSWLHLEQRRSSAPAFLYGAPGQYDESTKIEVSILFLYFIFFIFVFICF